MGTVKAPRSLRSEAAINAVDSQFDNYSGTKVSAVAGLIGGGVGRGALKTDDIDADVVVVVNDIVGDTEVGDVAVNDERFA